MLGSLMFTIASGSLAQVRRLSVAEGSAPPTTPFVAGLGSELWRQSVGMGERSDLPCAASGQTYQQSDASQSSITAQAQGDPGDAPVSTAPHSSSCLCIWLHSWAFAIAGSYYRFTDALTRSSHSLPHPYPGYCAESFES